MQTATVAHIHSTTGIELTCTITTDGNSPFLSAEHVSFTVGGRPATTIGKNGKLWGVFCGGVGYGFPVDKIDAAAAPLFAAARAKSDAEMDARIRPEVERDRYMARYGF